MNHKTIRIAVTVCLIVSTTVQLSNESTVRMKGRFVRILAPSCSASIRILSKMQPLENKRTKVQSGVARAKVLLKRDAAWLPGYPMEMTDRDASGGSNVIWGSAGEIVADESSVWTLDGEHLRRAQMTISKLRHRFPRALPKIADDVDDWLSRTDFLFELLKRAIHDGIAFNADDVLSHGILPKRWTQEMLRIKSTHPSLVELLDAVTFVALSDRHACERESLTWIEQNADHLALLCHIQPERPCELPILILSIRNDLSPELLKALTQCFSDPLIRDCRWESMAGGLKELHHALKKAVNQNEFRVEAVTGTETLGELGRTVLYRICSERPKQRRRFLQYLGEILTPELVRDVAETHRQVAQSERRLRRLLRRIQSGHESIPPTKTGRAEWRENATGGLEIAPERIATVVGLGKILRGLKQTRDEKTERWVDLLAAFPGEHAGLRVRLLAKWRHGWYGAMDRKSDFNQILKELSALLRRRGIAAPLLRHWYGYVDGKNAHDEFVVNTCYELEGKRTLATRTVRLLEAVLYDRDLDLGHKRLTSMVEFAQATDDDALSCALIEHLAEQPDRAYHATELRLAFLFGESIDETARMLPSLQDHWELTELATELKPLAQDPDLKAIVATRLAENEVGTLSRIAGTTSILNDIGQPMPKREVVSQPTDWIRYYPAEFWPVLESLAEATPDAKRIAKSVLQKAFPSPEALQEQIDALQSRLSAGVPPGTDEPRMRRRLENLQRRQTQTVVVPPARRDKLIGKLKRRTDDEILQRYAHECRHRAGQATKKQFGLREFPEELLVPPLDGVVREINRLNKPMRTLGVRLLFESFHRTTRNFDDELKNVSFRERMEALGIVMLPWLSDQMRHSATTADGTPYELAFTRDVFDFLLMGFHFDTCLSPNSFNFFSTVANAVDLNKRVVYGKTAAGKVIGRCLFALNDAGEVLTYYRYSHDPQDGFAEAVDQFAQRLATAMQTTLGSGGSVSKLVASDWYDDGPTSVDANWLGDGGIGAQLINTVSADRLLADLVDAVGDDFLRRRIVDLATDDRVRNRVEFLHSLLDRCGDAMSVRQKFIVAVNVESDEVSHRLLTQLRWSDIVRIVKRHQCNECDVFHGIGDYFRVFRVLTKYHPSLGLRAIRAARPVSIPSDLADPNKTRRRALAKAHERLGRKQLAEKLLEH